MKITKLAQARFLDARLRFLEGKILFVQGNKPAGIMHMRQAACESPLMLDGDDYLFYASALFNRGGKLVERDACEAVLTGIEKGCQPNDALLFAFLDCSTQRRDNSAVARIIGKLEEEQLVKAMDRVDSIVSNQTFYLAYDKVMLSVLDRLRNYSGISEAKRGFFASAYQKVRSKISSMASR
jgi:hypothetical protein